MGSYHSARLTALLSGTPAASNPELRTVLQRLAEEAKNRWKHSEQESFDFFSTIVDALIRIRGTANAAPRLTCLFHSAYFYFLQKRPAEALQVCAKAAELAKAVDSQEWLAKTSSMAGVIHGEFGNISEALLYYGTAIDSSRKAENYGEEIKSTINVGVALNYAGLFREAISCFLWATQESVASKTSDEVVAAAFANLAQSRMYLGEFEDGVRAIETSLAMSRSPVNAQARLSRVIREFTYVQLAIELGRLPEAKLHVANCVQHTRLAGSILCRVVCQIATGLYEVHLGNARRGLPLLEDALASAAGSDSLRTDALLALIKGYDRAGRPERALAHLETLVEHIRRKREQSLSVLLQMPIPIPFPNALGEASDLHAFMIGEARLQSKAAMRQALDARIELLERLAITADLKEEDSGSMATVLAVCLLSWQGIWAGNRRRAPLWSYLRDCTTLANLAFPIASSAVRSHSRQASGAL